MSLLREDIYRGMRLIRIRGFFESTEFGVFEEGEVYSLHDDGEGFVFNPEGDDPFCGYSFDELHKFQRVEEEGSMERIKMRDRIDRDFAYHSVGADQQGRMAELRERFTSLAHTVNGFVPAGREQEVAITRLEEALFFCNAGIAREE